MQKNFFKQQLLLIISLLCMSLIIVIRTHAQNPFEDAVKQLNSDNAKGYLQPWVTAFGTNLNSGFYHSADISNLGLTVRLDIIGMGTFIGDKQKKYKTKNPFDGTDVETATIFGEMGTVVSPDSLVLYQFQNGQVKTSFIPFVVPQLTIGDLYGTQGVIRYVQTPEINNVPEASVFGIGVRHNVSRYIPAVPVDLSAGFLYQHLKIGELFDATTFMIGAQVSKSFALLTLYGGLQYESISMDIGYEYKGSIPGYTPPSTKITLNVEGESQLRGTVGFNLSFFPVHLFADINIGSAIAASGGIGFGF